MSDYVIIVAGGSGSRMQASQPKQFLPLNGKSILQHTMEAFYRYNPTLKMVVALPPDYLDFWARHCEIKQIAIPHELTPGGSERFYTVQQALKRVSGEGVVAVHDGVRPLVSKATLKACFETARNYGAAIPVLPVNDSMRQLTGETASVPIERQHLRVVQTPQCFSIPLLQQAYDCHFDPAFTDDATVVERVGIPIHLVAGNPENIKITRPFDLRVAEWLLRATDTR